ncbi:zinc finger CCCH domain-containing protein [Citrus sinensis]|nr:zinc finger CCCH domain-containing protein [Citrus sinensis]
MSSTPKRSHEEGGHSSSSKYPQEDTGVYPKLTTSGVSNEYPNVPYEMAQDARVKISRSESRDSDRRSPLHSMYRMPSSSLHDSQVDSYPPASESRPESKDSKDNPRMDSRELFGEAKKDAPIKGDKDARYDSRGDDNKEVKHDRENHTELKSDVKEEKDGHGATASHVNWKESKEYLRGKRYPEPPGGAMDSWHTSRGSSQGPVEVGKDGSTVEDKDYSESYEAMGENKVDLKGEDRFKDKDRKRKDSKHREWGDRDKERSDRRSSSMQVGNSSSEHKESGREEREAEKWDRDRKDLSKDKERPKEREKDHTKRESWNSVEKEGVQNEKEVGDGSLRVPQPEQENPSSEQKKPKEFDGWKNIDREARDRRREREADIEGDRPEKRSRCYDKESDDGCADGEGGAERERDNFNYGVQQRKRMLRPRGSPQVGNRKAELSSVVYKVGECMQDLLKLWKEYEASQADKNGEIVNNGPTLEIRIPAEHVTATNRQVRGGQLWGTDIYTDDSDLVAVLMHTGYCRPTASPPPSAIQELRATIRVLPPQDCYTSEQRNNVRSRAWGAGSGCSYRVEKCCIVKKGGGTIDLEPCLTHSSTVEPTLAPMAVERTMTTRAAASNALRQQRFVREVTIQYNLCNEPWYELSFAGEKMVKAVPASESHDTETEKSQNHLLHSTNGEKNDGDNIMTDVFRWSRCKKPLPQKVMRSIGIPLPPEHVEVIEENLDWEDVQWSQTGVWIAGKEYTLARKGGGTIDLEPCLTHSSTVEPTLAPMAVERTMTTRAAASNALRQQRFVREVTIQYNLCNEPWIKYSISIVADKGLKKPLYTSARLKKGEVLYLETHSCRYELSFAGEKMVKAVPASESHDTETEKSQNHLLHSTNEEKTDGDNIMTDVFRWSRCKKPLPQKVMRSIGIPLPPEHVEVIEENLDWEDVQWSQTGVWIAGKEYTLARVHFLSKD